MNFFNARNYVRKLIFIRFNGITFNAQCLYILAQKFNHLRIQSCANFWIMTIECPKKKIDKSDHPLQCCIDPDPHYHHTARSRARFFLLTIDIKDRRCFTGTSVYIYVYTQINTHVRIYLYIDRDKTKATAAALIPLSGHAPSGSAALIFSLLSIAREMLLLFLCSFRSFFISLLPLSREKLFPSLFLYK